MLTDILLFVVGLIVGVMNAVAGGGMLVGFPALIAAGLSPLNANATGYLVMMPGQLASAVGYREILKKVPKIYSLFLIPCVTGAALGSYILRNTPDSHFGELVPWLLMMAVALFAFQPYLSGLFQKSISKRRMKLQPLVAFGLLLFVLSTYGGYFGAGFGFILLAFLSFTRLKKTHQMNALKSVAAVAMGLTALIMLAKGPFIDWQSGMVMGAGSVIGGYGGARFVQKIPSHASRILVIAIGIVAAAYLAVRNY